MKDCLGRDIREGDIVLYARNLSGGDPVMTYGRVVGFGTQKFLGNEKPCLLVQTPPPIPDADYTEMWRTDKTTKWSMSRQLFRVDDPPQELLDQF